MKLSDEEIREISKPLVDGRLAGRYTEADDPFLLFARAIEIEARKRALEDAADYFAELLEEYVREHGTYDHETDCMNFSQRGFDYVAELTEYEEHFRQLAKETT